MFRQKSTNDLYVENSVLQKRECFLNIARMLNILLSKFKYNIVAYNLNEYKSYTKQPHLIYSCVLHEISILRIKTDFLTLN